MQLNLQLGKAMGIVAKTAPYIVYRAIVYGIICACVAVALAFLAVVGKVFSGGAAFVLFAICAGAGIFSVRLLKEYVLYVLAAGHIALVTEIVSMGKLPSGIRQTEWAKERVMHYFKEVSALALVDQLVDGIIRMANRTVFDVMTALPIPSMEGLAKIVERIVHFSLTYIDESILAYTFQTKNENVFDAAKSGVLIYCQSWKRLLTNAVALTLLSYAFIVAATIFFLIPLGAVAWMLPAEWGTAKFLLFVLALFLGFSVKWILFDPIACTSTILIFLKEAETQTPDPTWESRIEMVSDKFKELKDKAAEKYREMRASKPQETETNPKPEPAESAASEQPPS